MECDRWHRGGISSGCACFEKIGEVEAEHQSIQRIHKGEAAVKSGKESKRIERP